MTDVNPTPDAHPPAVGQRDHPQRRPRDATIAFLAATPRNGAPMDRRTPTLGVLALFALTGCAAASTSDAAPNTAHTSASASPAAVGVVPIGSGPQTHYTVQRQPAAGSCHYRRAADGQPLPDRACTPGAVSPAVTQQNLASTICRTGYTATVRPPVSVTTPEKRGNAAAYAYGGTLYDAELDHLVSLELGGSPNDVRNLWVEPPSPGHRAGAGPNNPKDGVESRLHRAICSGSVTLAQAQEAIVTDWSTALKSLGLT